VGTVVDQGRLRIERFREDFGQAHHLAQVERDLGRGKRDLALTGEIRDSSELRGDERYFRRSLSADQLVVRGTHEFQRLVDAIHGPQYFRETRGDARSGVALALLGEQMARLDQRTLGVDFEVLAPLAA